MKKRLTKVLALMLVACLSVVGLAACTPKYTGGDTLVVGYDTFSSKFSPFFAKTAYDQDVANMTMVSLLGSDREGNMVLKGIKGTTTPYNGKDYTYYGIADCDIEKNSDGTVTYTFQIRKDIKFSDGKKLTADDAIFSMYVLCDPTYDGSSTLYSQPIKGVKEYRQGMDTLANLILAAGRGKESTFFTKDQADKYWAALDEAGKDFAKDIVDVVVGNYAEAYATALIGKEASELTEGEKVALGMILWGYGAVAEKESTYVKSGMVDSTGKTYKPGESDPTLEDYWKALEDAALTSEEDGGYGSYAAMSDTEAADEGLFEKIDAILGDDKDAYKKGIVTGDSAASIAGIEKIDDYSLRVTADSYDATTIYQLSFAIAPLHYYGSTDKFDVSKNMFGFDKGDLSTVRSKTTTPMGAGPYKFKAYENGVVSFEANSLYYSGAPKITNLQFKETPSSDKLSGVTSGAFDITDPNFNQATVDAIKDANGGELTGGKVTTIAVDNLGYGYLGINADNVKVGTDKSSEASKALRKAFATVFAVYRDTAINSYYGERAAIIQYPISNTSWAAPRPADEGYEIAYSKDADGNAIFKDGMSEQEKYDAALNAAVTFFKKAGYTYDEQTKKFTAAPAGAKMEYTILIPADGKGDHPNYAILTDAQKALETIGIKLEINDLTDSNQLWTSLESGTCAMWTAAWQATPDPDMYQVYHSTNIVGKGGTDSNHYAIADSELDDLIMKARTSDDTAYRKASYKKCLDIILDWGVEIPSYQRQNAYIFSTERVNTETITPDITPYWGWAAEIEKLEMK